MERDIDLVIPMVFPADPEWQRDYARLNGCPDRTVHHVRYRSWGTEELLVRCCMKYMPWLRRIHILLARESQVQPWMEALSRHSGMTELHMAFHRDFIPHNELPCFASPCIEMFLGRIPGLSERFIYANDDMFPLSPLAPEDFFRDGRPCLHIFEEEYPHGPNIFQRKCMNQQNMIGKPFGRRYTRTWLRSGHSFAPILKVSCDEVWRRHGNDILHHLNPLRRNDHSYNHYVYLLYQYFAGLSADHAPRCQYVGAETPTFQLPSILGDPRAGIVCLNDNESIKDWRERAAVVRREIEKKLLLP